MTKIARADFLVEIGTEELPPAALRTLGNAFADNLGAALGAARLAHGELEWFATPRRLAVVARELALAQEDREREQKGPPVAIAFDGDGKPLPPAEAFARKCGTTVDRLGRNKTEKGEWLSHRAVEPGASAAGLLPEIVRSALAKLSIPRRMRWGDSEEEFVRPVHWVVLLHGRDVIDGEILGIRTGGVTRGHRFHAPGELKLGTPGKYASVLEKKGFVIADFDTRRDRIRREVDRAASEAGGTALGDDALYDEVTALVEWPVAMTGRFDQGFLVLPKEVISATLTSHQRYFPIEGGDGRLMPLFITIANLESTDPEKVRQGNERVVAPRLADAAFFWETDRQTPLAERQDSLKAVVYQQGLGTLHDRSIRVAALATLVAQQLGAAVAPVARAAVLAKCDLLTGMVGEFPELQGVMGRYYAAASGEDEAVSVAIGEQYLPRFAGDALPQSTAGRILAVADKVDALAGIFVLGKKPSGNRDPFGLRRAALGVVRILVETGLDVDLAETVKAAVVLQPASGDDHGAVRGELYDFIVDRMRRYYLNAGVTQEVFESVRVKRPASLTDFDARLKAVAAFAQLEPAASLAAANKRTANILRQAHYDEHGNGRLDTALLSDAAEKSLYAALQAARQDVAPMLAARAYADALNELAGLREEVDTFFDEVMVMTEDEAVRTNRLALLAELRGLFLDIADVSRLTTTAE